MILHAEKSEYVPHPEGIWPSVCVDVIDLGEQPSEFQGQKRMVRKVRLVFESEAMTPDGRRMTVARSFRASLHAKAKLAEFLGKWRGRPVVPGDSIDLDKLHLACCTLVVSHQASKTTGEKYASIDAISKATRKVSPSGQYDAKAARERLRESGTLAGNKAATAATTAPAAPEPETEIPF